MLWCDSAAGPRKVFESLPPALQPLHGFRALDDLLPPGVRETLDALQPSVAMAPGKSADAE
eukprot:8383593-Alexandrium_andersonii.AAC.1